MENYELTKDVISWSPLAVMMLTTLLLIKKDWTKRVSIVFIIGWISIVVSVQIFWNYSFDYAPTEEIKTEVGMKDGGPRVGSFIFGWLYSGVIVVFLEGVIFGSMKIKSFIRKTQ